MSAISSFDPTASAIAANPYPYNHARGSFIPGYSLTQSPNSAWQTTSHCQFLEQTYHVSTSNATLTNAYTGPGLADFALQVKMTFLHGDCGGVLFRGNSTHKNYYFYRVCQDKTYQIIRANDTEQTNINHPWLTNNRDIHTQENIIGIIAQGNKIWLYVNNMQITCISDNSYAHGVLALMASSNRGNQLTQVAYSDLKLWTVNNGGDETCI